MDFGAIEVQIFVSLVLVLGALFVALVCDFLKGNNEALREQNIVLSVRQEERERHERRSASSHTSAQRAPATQPGPSARSSSRPLVPPLTALTAAPATKKAPAAPPRQAPPAIKEEVAKTEETPTTWATAEEQSGIDELAEQIRRKISWTAGVTVSPKSNREAGESATDKPAPVSEPAEEQRQPQPPVTQDYSEPKKPSGKAFLRRETSLPPLAKVTPIDIVAAEKAAASEAIQLAKELERVAEMTSAAGPRIDLTGLSVEEREHGNPVSTLDPDDTPTPPPTEDFQAEQFGVENQEEPAEETAEEEEVEDESSSDGVGSDDTGTPDEELTHPRLALPNGYRDYSELREALDSDQPFWGTVVSIGVSCLDGSRPGGSATYDSSDLPDELSDFVESLLTPEDFGCQRGPEEFILVIGDAGASAQRRLQYVSQRLWDYQIRLVGNPTALMFSWGAAEGGGEPLREAIESAKERMHQTKRTRERAPSEIHSYRIRTANK